MHHFRIYFLFWIIIDSSVLWSIYLKFMFGGEFKSITEDLPNLPSEFNKKHVISISFPATSSFDSYFSFLGSFNWSFDFTSPSISYMYLSSTFLWNLAVNTHSLALINILTISVLVIFSSDSNIFPLFISYSRISLLIVSSFFGSLVATTKTFSLSMIFVTL